MMGPFYVFSFVILMPLMAYADGGPIPQVIKEPTQFELMKITDEMNIKVELNEKEKFARFENRDGEDGIGAEKEPKSKSQLRMERELIGNTLNTKLGVPESVKDHTIMKTLWKHEN